MTLEKVKFFIFGAILIEFELKHFHRFTIDEYDSDLKREKKKLKKNYVLNYIIIIF